MTGENSCKVTRTGVTRIKDGDADVLIAVYALEITTRTDNLNVTAKYNGLSPADAMRIVDGWLHELPI